MRWLVLVLILLSSTISSAMVGCWVGLRLKLQSYARACFASPGVEGRIGRANPFIPIGLKVWMKYVMQWGHDEGDVSTVADLKNRRAEASAGRSIVTIHWKDRDIHLEDRISPHSPTKWFNV